ncbi:unnamed protein product [Trichobilharzia regenti]|nr:unnamed protein product [Trichobilharzia regenti]
MRGGIPDLRRNYVGSGYSIPTTTNFPPTSSTNSSSSQKLKNQQQQPLDDGINGNATGEETDQPVKDNFSNYQLIDYLIWRNRELEQELCEIRQRLSQYEKC